MQIQIRMNTPVFLATFMVGLTLSAAAQAAGVAGQGTWETTLLGRDINRNAVSATSADAVYLYDTTLDVTWLRNADVNGEIYFGAAKDWASALVTGTGANAVSGWRLPTVAANPVTATYGYTFDGSTWEGYNVPSSSSELASLFFNTLGNISYIDTSGASRANGAWGLTNTGSFQNMQSANYWLVTTEPHPGNAWSFSTLAGAQLSDGQYDHFGQREFPAYAMVVRSGDVISMVPESESYSMMLVGLGLLGAVVRRRAQAHV